MPICMYCKKAVNNDLIVCDRCNTPFHDYCSKKYIGSRGAKQCCVQLFSRSKSTRSSRYTDKDRDSDVCDSAVSSGSPHMPLFVFSSADVSVRESAPNTTMSIGTPIPSAGSVPLSLSRLDSSVHTLTDTGMHLHTQAPTGIAAVPPTSDAAPLMLRSASLDSGNTSIATTSVAGGQPSLSADQLLLQQISNIALEVARLRSDQSSQFAALEKRQNEQLLAIREENTRAITALNQRVDDLLLIEYTDATTRRVFSSARPAPAE